MALTFLGALAGGVGVQLNIALGKARHHRRTRSETLRVGGPRCVLGAEARSRRPGEPHASERRDRRGSGKPAGSVDLSEGEG